MKPPSLTLLSLCSQLAGWQIQIVLMLMVVPSAVMYILLACTFKGTGSHNKHTPIELFIQITNVVKM
jgi:hypothetical protein